MILLVKEVSVIFSSKFVKKCITRVLIFINFKFGSTVDGFGNQIVDANDNFLRCKKIKLNIKGNNNVIKIQSAKAIKNSLSINIYGDNNYIFLGNSNCLRGKVTFNLGSGLDYCIRNSKIVIGNNNGFSDRISFTTVNSNAKILVGDNCMFSSNIELYNTDGHPIYNASSTNKGHINYVKDMIIGNHVWIGYGAVILKNVNIPDNCIIGRNSVVASKNFIEPNCVIAGNPAKIVKRNINWDVYSKDYVDNVLTD